MIKKIIFWLVFIFIIFIILLIVIMALSSINDEVINQRKYGFSICSTKSEVFKTIKKLQKEAKIDYFSLGFSRKNYKYSMQNADKLYKYFLEWQIELEHDNHLRLIFDNNKLEKFFLIKPRKNKKRNESYYITSNITNYRIKNHIIKLGMSNNDIISIIQLNKEYIIILSFIDNSIIEDIDPIILDTETSRNWSIRYNSKFNIDYLRLYFNENNMLVKMIRGRNLIETP